MGGVSLVPVLVVTGTGGPPLTGVASVAGGSAHTVALTTSGNELAWGSNSSHQLGNNSSAAYAVPVLVRTDGFGSILTNAVKVAAGGDTTAAVTSSGQVKQAGNHYDGTTCQNAMNVPGTLPTTAPLPVPKPGAQLPSPDCDNQQPTLPGTYDVVEFGLHRAHWAQRALNLAVVSHTTPRPTSDLVHTPPGYGPGMNKGHLLAHMFGGISTDAETAERNITALFGHQDETGDNVRNDRLPRDSKLRWHEPSSSQCHN